ncbi:la-related protein 7-like [Uloborus diversus]|uniref:la-related protein 7-like n=1 Tax=Uloborus diversus TaxID=327109 RepID=UPI00240917CA|nr:la-related protein 7-like [Uloborus diversus]
MDESKREKETISKRKLKKLYSKIRTQMEFYFSDSNLVRDKFLQELISQDPNGYVELDLFRNFNKIKALTDDITLITSAVSRSDMLQLSEDQKKIKRVTSISPSKDFDACTIYVERLPSYADQKWVKDVFEHFGHVDYVNVPQYKISHKIKGFAFVEFQDSESVQRACDFYKACSGKESASEDELKDFKSGKKKLNEDFIDKKQKKNENRWAAHSAEKNAIAETDVPNQSTSSNNNSFNIDERKENMHSTPITHKRKLNESEEITAPKKFKRNEDKGSKSEDSIKKQSSSTSNENSMELSMEKSENIQEKNRDGSENITDNTDVAKNKRKRKNSKKSRNDRPNLRVMSKAEWKAYRNKYLDLQRSTMSYLKKTVMLQTQELKEQDTMSKSNDTSAEGQKKGLHFQPGVILKIKLGEPVKNSSDIKDQVKANAIVAYVDAPIDEPEIFVRCHNSEEAQAILSEGKLNQLGNVELLENLDESKYWEKIENDRKVKLSNPVIRKKRGRDKIINKATKLEEMKNKHIYFDE